MARTTVKDLEARIAEQNAQIDKLVSMIAAISQPAKAEKPAEPKQLVKGAPDYATPAQLVEYEKLAKRALETRDAVAKAAGTESVSCFIPVPTNAARMPHSIKWTVTYSK